VALLSYRQFGRKLAVLAYPQGFVGLLLDDLKPSFRCVRVMATSSVRRWPV
jgi:hypothetical protein